VLNWGRIEVVGQGLKHGLARHAVIRKNTNLDEAVGVQGGIGFFFDGVGQTAATDHDHGVEVMGFGAVHFALRGGKLDMGHGRIIGEGSIYEISSQKQQGESGVA
jgi:hypothetical protein